MGDPSLHWTPRGRDVWILDTSELQLPWRGILKGLAIGIVGEGTWPSQVVSEQVNWTWWQVKPCLR